MSTETDTEYHDNPALSWSKLKTFIQSPARYKAQFIDRTRPKSDTPAMRTGRLMHLAILEPDRYAKQVAVAPAVDRRTKDGKAAWYEFQAANDGRDIISASEGAEINAVARSIADTPAAAFLYPLRKEVVRRVDTEYGTLQCRIDAMDDDGNVTDLKTTDDITGIERQIWNLGYHLQEAFYRIVSEYAGEPLNDWQFLFVEKNPPYERAAIRIDPETRELARAEVFHHLTRFARCARDSEWPGLYPVADTVTVKAPEWLTKRMEQIPDDRVAGLGLLAAFETGGEG